jgi:hypothetical protein
VAEVAENLTLFLEFKKKREERREKREKKRENICIRAK